MKRLILLLLLLPCVISAQSGNSEDIWAPLKPLIGKWEGRGEGKSGISKIEAEFRFVLREKYMEVRHKGTFEPQEKNPKGEVHEDLGFISYDSIRKKFVFRQFHVEGFINQYVLDRTISGEINISINLAYSQKMK